MKPPAPSEISRNPFPYRSAVNYSKKIRDPLMEPPSYPEYFSNGLKHDNKGYEYKEILKNNFHNQIPFRQNYYQNTNNKFPSTPINQGALANYQINKNGNNNYFSNIDRKLNNFKKNVKSDEPILNQFNSINIEENLQNNLEFQGKYSKPIYNIERSLDHIQPSSLNIYKVSHDSRPIGNQYVLMGNNLNIPPRFQPSFDKPDNPPKVSNLNNKFYPNLEEKPNYRLRSINSNKGNYIPFDNYANLNLERSNLEASSDNPYCEIYDKSIQKTYKSETVNQLVEMNEVTGGMLYQGTLNKPKEYNLEIRNQEKSLPFIDQINPSIYKFQKANPNSHIVSSDYLNNKNNRIFPNLLSSNKKKQIMLKRNSNQYYDRVERDQIEISNKNSNSPKNTISYYQPDHLTKKPSSYTNSPSEMDRGINKIFIRKNNPNQVNYIRDKSNLI